MRARTRVIFAAAAALAVLGCGAEDRATPETDAEAAPVPVTAPQHAYLTSLSGDVTVQRGGTPADAEPGERLADGSLVTVAANSYIDLQFGERAFVRVHGPSAVSIARATGPATRAVMEVFLQTGEVTASVRSLGSSEVFRVRTGRALYVARGTSFHVASGRSDTLSVGSGEVAVFPASLDVPALLDSLAESDRAVRAALAGLEEAAPVVTANQRAVLDPSALARSELLAAELREKLRQVNAATVAERQSLVEQLLQAIRAASGSLGAVSVVEGPVSDDVARKLAMTDAARLLPVPKDPQNLSLLDTEDPSSLVKFTLRTLPQNAEIYLGGVFVGTSVYRGILRANQSLSIRVTKEGYRERRLEIDRARSEVITVQLERLPPWSSAESFLKAILADDIGTVRTYIAEGGSVDVRTGDGVPALVLASGIVPVLRGQAPDLSYHREILRTIVAAGANLEVTFLVEGSTFKLMHAAVLAGVAGFDVMELMEIMVTGRADVDATIVLEGEELTPLAIAVRWALYTGQTQEEIIKVLLTADASLDIAIRFNDELLTLREIAVQLLRRGEVEDPELIRLLRQRGAVI